MGWYPDAPITIKAHVECNGLCREEQQEVLVCGPDSVTDAKGTYLGSGWVITPCVQTLQSLGTFTGPSYPEIQCRLHHPDIETKVIYLHCVCGGLCDSGENERDCMIYVYN